MVNPSSVLYLLGAASGTGGVYQLFAQAKSVGVAVLFLGVVVMWGAMVAEAFED